MISPLPEIATTCSPLPDPSESWPGFSLISITLSFTLISALFPSNLPSESTSILFSQNYYLYWILSGSRERLETLKYLSRFLSMPILSIRLSNLFTVYWLRSLFYSRPTMEYNCDKSSISKPKSPGRINCSRSLKSSCCKCIATMLLSYEKLNKNLLGIRAPSYVASPTTYIS